MLNSLENNLVSIIIPSYNYAHFLPQTLTELLNQTHQNWECLVIDNNSTDDTKAVVESFTKKDKRFNYYLQQKKGPSAARNLGIEKANGTYIQFLDADDLLQYDKLKSALSFFNSQPNTDIVYSGMRYFQHPDDTKLFYKMELNSATDKEWMPYCEGTRNDILPYILKQNIMVISAPLIKKTSLNELGYFDETLDYNEDWELWLRFVIANKTIHFDNSENTLSLIRVHKTSHSNNPFNMYLSGLSIELKYINNIENNILQIEFQNKINYSIHVIERLLYIHKNDTLFIQQAISKLIPVYNKWKYHFWNFLITKKQMRLLSLFLTINYYFNALKYRIKNA